MTHAQLRMQSADPKHPDLTAGSDLPMSARSVWLLSWVVELSVVAFAGLVATAMNRYPGGTFWDRGRVGHAFWENFLCDLLLTPSLSGAASASSARLASLGMLGLVAGMTAFVGVAPSLLSDPRRMTRHVRLISILACAVAACAPLFPSDRFGAYHAAAVLGAGVPLWLSLMALIGNMLGQATLPRFMRWVSIGLCLAVGLSLGLYAAEVLFSVRPLRLVPIVSRLSTLSLLVWLVGAARMARARSAAELAPSPSQLDEVR